MKPAPGDAAGKKVVVAMSGGVDSSVAAALLQDQGYQVVGCFMRLGSDDSVDPPEAAADPTTPACPPTSHHSLVTSHQSPVTNHHSGCCSLNDAADARLVAAILRIPFYVLNFKADFDRVISYFVAEYNAGRTPNPCVRCNDWLKFGKLAAYAASINADYVATGHYARTELDPATGRTRLLRGLDHRKDQSYVLFGTRPALLQRLLLPIGGYHKAQVRDLARRFGLPVHDKPDSQEICFVPDNNYAGLIERRTPEQVTPGAVLDERGQPLGSHPGHQHYTIGQRRGLGVAKGVPLYVIAKNPAANTITLGPREALLSAGLRATQANWLVDPNMFSGGLERSLPEAAQTRANSPDQSTIECQVKIRSNAQPVPATLHLLSSEALEIRFATPQPAVSPGQAVVCYAGDVVLGGAWISEALKDF